MPQFDWKCHECSTMNIPSDAFCWGCLHTFCQNCHYMGPQRKRTQDRFVSIDSSHQVSEALIHSSSTISHRPYELLVSGPSYLLSCHHSVQPTQIQPSNSPSTSIRITKAPSTNSNPVKDELSPIQLNMPCLFNPKSPGHGLLHRVQA